MPTDGRVEVKVRGKDIPCNQQRAQFGLGQKSSALFKAFKKIATNSFCGETTKKRMRQSKITGENKMPADLQNN